MRYAVIENGVVENIIEANSDFSLPGKILVKANEDSKIGNSYMNGVFEPLPIPAPPTYSELRQRAYPSLEDQADMQYWDAVNGTTTWQDAIKTVKAEFPKP